MQMLDRVELLRILESVMPGLTRNKSIDQAANCFVFKDGRVSTFNDEIYCTRPTTLDFSGAIESDPVLKLLNRLPDDSLQMEQKEGQLLIKGKRRRGRLRIESQIRLPVGDVESPGEWHPLPDNFGDAVDTVHKCASKDDDDFVLTCVHMHPDYIEASDKFQIIRYNLDLGLTEPLLVRASSLKRLVGYDVTQYSVTGSWIHFTNSTDLVISCRKYMDEYTMPIGDYLQVDRVSTFVLPGGLDEVVARVEIFSEQSLFGNLVLVDLNEKRIVLEGEGAYGKFEEMKPVTYTGDPVRFYITPKLLLELSERSNECQIAQGKLLVNGGAYKYASCTLDEAATKG